MTYILRNKAKGMFGRLMQLCLLAAVPFFVGCADKNGEFSYDDAVPMTFYLQTSGSHQTRAYIGELAAENEAESKINTIQVWFFDGTSTKAAAYSSTIANNKVTLTVPRTVISQGTADVYIIANPEAAGITTLSDASTLAEIQAATIAADKFSAATPTTAVPEAGLPMSRIIKGLALTEGGEPKTSLGEIKITRAVSKIRFAFGMYTGDLGNIVGISLDGQQIASSEYILPVDPTGNTADYTDPYLGDLKSNIAAGSYETAELLLGSKTEGTLVANTAIHTTTTSDNPSNYAWKNWIATTEHAALTDQQKAEQYNTDITPFVTNTVYLRESDKKITGTIYYRLTSDGDVKSTTFTMDTESTVQDFARNHVWIVYSYFEGGKLWVYPTVAPWTNATTTDYTIKLSTDMRLFDSWLYRYDTDEKDFFGTDSWGDPLWKTWTTSHMVVASGTVPDENAEGDRPANSPLIQLVTTTGTATGEAITLKLDSDKFKLIKATKNETGIVTEYVDCGQSLSITTGENVYTYFYVVPVDGTEEGATAKVTLIYTDPVVGDQKIPFNNNSLPGYSDDSSEIWVYCVDPDNYSNIAPSDYAGKLLKMYYESSSNPIVPTENQN